MTKILAIGASNSQTSINKTLATYTASQISEGDVITLDLNDFEMPIYSVDREQKNGIPLEAQNFIDAIEQSDAIVLSLAEYNGSYSSAYKNILDWVSRGTKSIWANKPMFLMASSPGPRGGLSVLNTAKVSIPYQGAELISIFSLPSFYQNFTNENGILDTELKASFDLEVENFKKVVYHEATT